MGVRATQPGAPSLGASPLRVPAAQ